MPMASQKCASFIVPVMPPSSSGSTCMMSVPRASTKSAFCSNPRMCSAMSIGVRMNSRRRWCAAALEEASRYGSSYQKNPKSSHARPTSTASMNDPKDDAGSVISFIEDPTRSRTAVMMPISLLTLPSKKP